jgi:malate synthase
MRSEALASKYAVERGDEILTSEALDFVADLHRRFAPQRRNLLEARSQRREEVARTGKLDFLAETREVREASWSVAPLPSDLLDRRVEITGPTERKMAINALNSGAQVWLADFEDANAPTWANMVEGHVNLVDAIDGVIEIVVPDGKSYRLTASRPATIMVRPRGWHLEERHLLIDDQPVVAALFDFGLHFFHNARRLMNRGSGPYFYLPKTESHLETRLWNDVFNHAQDALDIPRGTVRATVLIETIPAAFEMDEILYELRDHSAGLNAGRWDYLFSFIKFFRDQGAEFVLPDRNAVTMTAPMMRSYTELLVSTCHRRQACAIGGMAAVIPNRRDAHANELALTKVRQDKEREAADGFDGSWVAHPDLVSICKNAFDEVLGKRPNQIDRVRDDVRVLSADLLAAASTPGEITEAGLRNDVTVCLQYLEAWLRGQGAVAVLGLMEDVATAEVARSQIWQWIRNGVELADGTAVSRELVARIADDEIAQLDDPGAPGDPSTRRWADARRVFDRIALTDDYIEFLTFATLPLID